MNQKSFKYPLFLIPTGLILLVGIAFEPLRHNDFVDYDNISYILDNPHVLSGLTGSSIAWAFTTGHAANWHPLTWLSHMLDIELFGLNPQGHHFHNLLLHMASTVLLFWILYLMTGRLWPSAFLTVLFGIHPLRVESVAWAAERKDVLSMFFCMLTLLAYLNYARKGGVGKYLLVLLSFALGLMSKSMLVTLPVLMLLLDYWPLERYKIPGNSVHMTCKTKSWPQLLIEKIPLFILALISCLVTFLVQQHGKSVTLTAFPIRVFNAFFAYKEYLCKIFWPHHLAVLYPFPVKVYPLWPPTIAAIILAGITVFVVYSSLQKPYWMVGWMWYLISLLPVIGIIQVGSQTMADRYTYLPSIGISMIISWAVADFASRQRIGRWIIIAGTSVCIAAMVFLTRTQITYWKNSVELYRHTLSVTQQNYIIHNYLGHYYLKQGHISQAMEQIRISLDIQPDYADALQSMAFIYITSKDYDKALDCLKTILKDNPENAPALFNTGIILDIRNRTDEALEYYERAGQSDPTHYKAFSRAGLIYLRQGKLEKATDCFRRSLSIKPDYPEAWRGLNQCYGSSNTIQ